MMTKEWSSYNKYQNYTNSWRSFLNEESVVLTEQEKQDLLQEIGFLKKMFKRKGADQSQSQKGGHIPSPTGGEHPDAQLDRIYQLMGIAKKSGDPELTAAAAELETSAGDRAERPPSPAAPAAAPRRRRPEPPKTPDFDLDKASGEMREPSLGDPASMKTGDYRGDIHREPNLGDPASVEPHYGAHPAGPAVSPERTARPRRAPPPRRAPASNPEVNPEDAPDPRNWQSGQEERYRARQRAQGNLQEKLIAAITEAILDNIEKSTRK